MNSSQPLPAADAEAALWAARLEGSTLNATDRTALDAWLAAAPSHRTLLSSYCQFSADLELELPALVAAGRIAMPSPAAPRRSAAVTWITASAFAAAAAIAVTVWFQSPRVTPQTIATAVAQRQSIVLADGTRVELNARTSLQVELSRSERRVRLASGEAFFQVRKDSSRPFIVETPAGSVRVTGTTFNVLAASPSTLAVTVVEGSVAVRPAFSASSSFALTANDQLTASSQPGATVKKLTAAALANTLAWRQGTIVFEDIPLAEALARFAHYHGRSIIASATASPVRISSSVNLDDLDGFLASLADLKPHVKVDRDATGVYHVSLRTEL